MKILVLAMDEKGAVGVTSGEGVSPILGLQMVQAAASLFRDQIMEIEVQRRVDETQQEEKEAE